MDESSRELVSVLLPCFNAEQFLPEALESVLRQTYRSLELVAIDDGSSDATREVLEEFAQRDGRVRVLANEQNFGLIRTLNKGIAEARGEYIARMDADDVTGSNRIERQVELLESRPEIDLVGTGAWKIDADGRVVGRVPVRCTGPTAAPFLTLLAMPTSHPTVLARAEVMKSHLYRDAKDCLHAEDYDFFTRLMTARVGLSNIDAPLHRSRRNPTSVSRRFGQIQVDNFAALARCHLERTMGVRLERGQHCVLVNRIDGSVTIADLRGGLRWLDRLQDLFLETMDANDTRGRAEVPAIATQQRVDILGQVMLKGSPALKLASAPLLMRYGPSLLSPPGRRHLAAKLPIGLTRRTRWRICR